MSKASAVSPIAIAITPKLHSNPSDSMLITNHSSIATAFVQLKKACDYKKCAILEIIALLSINPDPLVRRDKYTVTNYIQHGIMLKIMPI